MTSSADTPATQSRGRTHRLPDVRLAPVVLGIALHLCLPDAWAQATPATPSSPSAVTSVALYDADVLANTHGGAERGASYQGMFRWQISVDGERALGLADTSAYLNLMATHRAGPDVLAGEAQGVDNMAAPSGVRVEEAWVQHNFMDGHLSALAGRYDLNSEFYRLNSAGLFLNSSFGVGPEFSGSGQAGPSIFPRTSLGVRVAYKPVPDLVIRTALLDGVPVDRAGGSTGAFRSGDGLLAVYELAWLYRPSASPERRDRRFMIGRASGITPYQDKIAIGGWHYTADFNDLSAVDAHGQPLRRHGSSGMYLIADKLVYQAPSPAGAKVAAFVQLGAADARVNRFGSYLGLGAVASNFMPSRPSDELGAAIAIARNGDHYLDSQQIAGLASKPAEATVELSWLMQVNSHLSVQPDVQYVIHPNTTAAANALALQLRAEIAF